MPTWTFIKQLGAPTGPINIDVATGTFLIDDTTHTSISTTDLQSAGLLRSVPFLKEQSSAVSPSASSLLRSFSLEADYGAPTVGSVQTALQNAINDILINNGGGRLLLQPRIYDFDAIVWPTIGLDKPTAVIEFAGASPLQTVGFVPGVGLTLAQGGDMPAPSHGTILRASLTSGSAFGNIAAWSNIMPAFSDCIVRVPANPQWHGIDAGWCTNVLLSRVIIDQGRSWGDGSNPLSAGPIVQPTNTGVIGVVAPGSGNGGVVRMSDLLVCGYYYGLMHSEHFDGDRITLGKNVIGLRPVDGWHAARVGRMSLYWNQIGIQPTQFNVGAPVTRLNIDELDTEEDPVGGNWYSTQYQINDPNNLLRGQMRFHRMRPSIGPSFVLLRRGGAYFNTSHVNAPSRGLIDSVGFEGANVTSPLPNSWNGQTPTALRGTWGISSQRAYLSTISGSALGDLAVWDSGSTQVILHSRIKVPTTASASNVGLAFCAVDANNYIAAALTSTGITLYKIDTSVFTTLGSGTITTLTNGQEVDLRLHVIGKTLRVWVDGVLKITYTLTAAEWTKYSASTAHGLFAYTSGFEPGGATGSRWDFFRVEPSVPLSA